MLILLTVTCITNIENVLLFSKYFKYYILHNTIHDFSFHNIKLLYYYNFI